MENTINEHDKQAEKVIKDLVNSLKLNLDSTEWAKSNLQRCVTMSILDIRNALFELTKWQNQQIKPVTDETKD